jgi:hypothetical protein
MYQAIADKAEKEAFFIVNGQVSPGFWRQHEVIKTRLASNKEIQTNEYGFHTIVVKIYKL